MKCKNCKGEIDERNVNSEHVIHQAIGGLLVSDKIYCEKCNSKVGSSCDSKFTKIFVPITQNLNIKTSRKKSDVKYDAIVKDRDGKTYIGKYKGDKLISIHSTYDNTFIKRVEADSYSNFTLSKIFLDIYNEDFYTGLIKIAENYAIDNGIDISYLIQSRETKVFGERIIPFFPMNIFDEYLDEYTSFELNDLLHVLIMFNIKKRVYVYIELFSVFKFYVLVSDSYEGNNIYVNYCQKLIKNNFDENRVKQLLKISRYKDAFIICNQYGIELNKNGESLEQSCKRIEDEAFNIIRKKAYKINYLEYILNKNSEVVLNKITKERNFFLQYYLCSSQYLCDEEVDYYGNVVKNECINNKNFRIYNSVISNMDTILEEYPDSLKKELKFSNERYNKYFQSSLNKLSKLIKCDEIKVIMNSDKMK